jgi:hypothetical protein
MNSKIHENSIAVGIPSNLIKKINTLLMSEDNFCK